MHVIHSQEAMFLIDSRGGLLSQGAWRARVEADEFRAWAAYSGIDLKPVQREQAEKVILKNETDKLLFRDRWIRTVDGSALCRPTSCAVSDRAPAALSKANGES